MKLVEEKNEGKKLYWMTVERISKDKVTILTKSRKTGKVLHLTKKIENWNADKTPEELVEQLKNGNKVKLQLGFILDGDGLSRSVNVEGAWVGMKQLRKEEKRKKEVKSKPSTPPQINTPPKGKINIERVVDEVRNETRELYAKYLNAGYSPDEARTTILNTVMDVLNTTVLSALPKENIEEWIRNNKEVFGVKEFNGLTDGDFRSIEHKIFSNKKGFEKLNSVVTSMVTDAVAEFFHERGLVAESEEEEMEVMG